MILKPIGSYTIADYSTPSKLTGNKYRVIYVLRYALPAAASDMIETYTGLMKAAANAPVKKIFIQFKEVSGAYEMSYVADQDATFREHLLNFGSLIEIGAKSAAATVKETAGNFAAAFEPSGIFDDLKKIFSEAKSWLILIIVLLVILFVWGKMK